ncbi:hypothetical protein MED121_04073 [Marinomonas sp. MED121]|uniref:hypothetical protein n=1 Tax=Marinomonas sp. MED121 TaxID=314277 RepID=UPI000068FA78|nr:hypothetical protein [Marinomonas sp. MED121]EAQ63918.1 hypothetical protein MED121_04073 [Marinomonas sp. MED121]
MEDDKHFYIDLKRTLIKDGPKFLSHTVMAKGDVVFLKPTLGAMIFCIIYIVVGLFLLGLAGLIYWNSRQLDLTVFIGMFGGAIGLFGMALIKPFMKRARFDKNTGLFDNNKDRDVKLRHIVSLQILNKIVERGQAPSYQCFELNMLTKNGRRINILNHNDLPQMQLDAAILGNFLKAEVLDLRREIEI